MRISDWSSDVCSSDLLQEVITGVRKDVEAGLPLSDAMERHPNTFNPLYVAMTRAGETGGMLDSALIRVADPLEAADSLRRQVKAALRSDERRVGNECVSTGRSRWARSHKKKKAQE